MMRQVSTTFTYGSRTYEASGTVFQFRDGDNETGYSSPFYEVNITSITDEDGEEFENWGSLGEQAEEALIEEAYGYETD